MEGGGKRRREPREGRRRNARKGSDTRVCTKCSKTFPLNHFSKKQIRHRNPKRLLCFTCLGKPIPRPAEPPIKKECQECGKVLSSENFSKTQWEKSGECKRCIERKKKRRVVCTVCSLPSAHAGFTMCRGCYLTQKKEDQSSKLPIGVRYLIPNFRDERILSFRTSQLSLNSLVGNYHLVYVSIDGEEKTLSSSVEGSLIFQTESSTEDLLTGSVNMAHSQLHKRFDPLCSFKVSEKTTDLAFKPELRGFFASHVHQFAPDSSWHDPSGDCYTRHGDGMPGKLKIVNRSIALPLWFSTLRNIRPPRNADTILKQYEDTSKYWVCRHFDLSDDVGRLIRKFVCPSPILQIMEGDIFLVAAKTSKWQTNSEVIIVARKCKG